MNNHPSINDFASASAYLAKGRDKTQRTLHGRHTIVYLHPDQTIRIRYHNTDIVTYRQNGDVILNSGGYKTVTTKRKINEYASVRLWQHKSIWYVNGELFEDGATLHANGKISGTLPALDAKRQNKLVRDINTYARAYVDALFAGNVPAPSGGDCWICLIFKSDDTQHLTAHMKEKYYVPSLIMRAMESESATAWDYVKPSDWNKRVVMNIWQEGGSCNWMESSKSRIVKVLRRYMRLQFGLPSSN